MCLGGRAAVLSEREAQGRRRAGVGEPGPGAQGKAVPIAPRLAGRISGVEIQPLVPHFHKGEPVHRRFPPAGAASASRDPLLRWPLGVLAGVRPSPAGGAGRAAGGSCRLPRPLHLPAQGAKVNEGQGLWWKGSSFGVTRDWGVVQHLVDWMPGFALSPSLDLGFLICKTEIPTLEKLPSGDHSAWNTIEASKGKECYVMSVFCITYASPRNYPHGDICSSFPTRDFRVIRTRLRPPWVQAETSPAERHLGFVLENAKPGASLNRNDDKAKYIYIRLF